MPRYSHEVLCGHKPPCYNMNCPNESDFMAQHDADADRLERYYCSKHATAFDDTTCVWPLRYEEELQGDLEDAVGRTQVIDEKAADNNAKKNFDESKIRLIRNHPFYGSLLINIDVIWTRDVPTAGIDGLRMYLNPDFCAPLINTQMDFLLVHEIQHIAHLHPFRKRGRDHKIWNAACDYIINGIINEEVDFTPPSKGILLDDRFDGQSPEYVYKVLWDEAEKIIVYESGGSESQASDGGNGVGGDQDEQSEGGVTSANKGKNPEPSNHPQNPANATLSSPAGDVSNPSISVTNQHDAGDGCGNERGKEIRHVKVDWLHGDVMDPVAMDEMERGAIEAKIKSLTFQAAYHARAIGADQRVANAVLDSQAPKANWQISLQTFVSNALDKDDYSYRRPNRRYVPQGVYMPSLEGKKPPKLMAVVIDISSSIDDRQLQQFWPELAGLIGMHPNLRFKVYFVNTEITEEKEIGIEDLPLDFQVEGCGGTRFSPAFDQIEEDGLPVSGLIYFTDMEACDFPVDPPYPVVWLNFGRRMEHSTSRSYQSVPPFGDVVDMN